MTEKTGRNDPCPCGSGKKFKSCCMNKQEEPKKTYTTSGKRKFKAKVLTSSELTAHVFQSTASQTQTEATPTEPLKFRMTSKDYSKEPTQKTDLPFDIPGPEKKPEEEK